MSLITVKNKNDGDLRPYSTNPVYLTPIHEECDKCVAPGRKKIFKTVWQWYKHQLQHHVRHPDDKIKIEIQIREYAKKIIRGESLAV